MISIKLDGYEKAVRRFDKKVVDKAATRAVNDAARASRTETSRAIRDRFNVKAKRLSKEVKNVRLARPSNVEAEVKAEGRPIGLMNFGAKWVRNVGGQARTTTATRSRVAKRRSKNTGVTVTIEKGQRTILPNAFIGRGRRGAVDGAGAMRVFQRTNLKNNRSGLMSKSSITIASMMRQERVMTRVIKRAGDVLNTRFKHHLSRLL